MVVRKRACTRFVQETQSPMGIVVPESESAREALHEFGVCGRVKSDDLPRRRPICGD
jgi:hypothetical protein